MKLPVGLLEHLGIVETFQTLNMILLQLILQLVLNNRMYNEDFENIYTNNSAREYFQWKLKYQVPKLIRPPNKLPLIFLIRTALSSLLYPSISLHHVKE